MPKKSEKKTEEKPEKEIKKEEKVTISEAEFEKEVIKLAKEGLTSEKIGETLRKKGIHPKEQNKKISKILKNNEAYINPDLKNVEEKLGKITKHLEKNKQDKRAKREKDRVFAHVRKLKLYHGIEIKRKK